MRLHISVSIGVADRGSICCLRPEHQALVFIGNRKDEKTVGGRSSREQGQCVCGGEGAGGDHHIKEGVPMAVKEAGASGGWSRLLLRSALFCAVSVLWKDKGPGRMDVMDWLPRVRHILNMKRSARGCRQSSESLY
jgi:hypothetical protein